jgi:chaperonin GroEL
MEVNGIMSIRPLYDRIVVKRIEEQETTRTGLVIPIRLRKRPGIVLNCGTDGAVVVEKIRGHQNPNFGFNASTEQYEDLVRAGVIDPTKVTRTALQNAASIASLMLTTGATV